MKREVGGMYIEGNPEPIKCEFSRIQMPMVIQFDNSINEDYSKEIYFVLLYDKDGNKVDCWDEKAIPSVIKSETGKGRALIGKKKNKQ